MLFNSHIFLFLFLPLVLIGWFVLNKIKCYQMAQVFLLGMSCWFYGYFNPIYLTLLIGSILVNYSISRWIKRQKHLPYRKGLLAIGLLCNLLMLFYFKYYNFFIENINWLLKEDFLLKNLVLPLGISFFTFQQLSFLIDCYKKEDTLCTLLEYSCYITFFPQLIAGPIVLQNELIPQLQNKELLVFNSDNFLKGCYLFVLGLAKKVLLADTLALTVNYAFFYVYYLDTFLAILMLLVFALQLYFDFSGYSDMARGIALMFSLELPQNFQSPYHGISMQDFWKRWHLTLTRFFTKYVYVPLGGSRRGKWFTFRNTLIVFVLSGLWHGASWSFLFWGIWNGFFVGLNQMKIGIFKNKFIGWLSTMSLFGISLIFFRSNSFDLVIVYFQKLFSLSYNGNLSRITNNLQIPELYVLGKLGDDRMYMIFFAVLLIICIYFIKGKTAYQWVIESVEKKTGAIICSLLFVWVIISLSQVSTFLYFNF